MHDLNDETPISQKAEVLKTHLVGTMRLQVITGVTKG